MLRLLPAVLLLAAVPAHADERSFMLTGFDRIRVDGPFEVEVGPGSAGARAEGDARALDRVSVRVNDTTLVIAPGLNGAGGFAQERAGVPRIRVTTPMLRGIAVLGGAHVTAGRMRGQRVDLSLTGAGTLEVGEIDADQLSAVLVGTGAMRVAGRAAMARFASNGAGTIEAEGLNAGTLTVNAQSAGDARFHARTTATIVATGSGSVAVSGPATCTVRGSAPVACGDDRTPQ